MFLIDFVDGQHVFASAGYLATPRLKYRVTNRRVIVALLEMYKFDFFHFCWVMLASGCEFYPQAELFKLLFKNLEHVSAYLSVLLSSNCTRTKRLSEFYEGSLSLDACGLTLCLKVKYTIVVTASVADQTVASVVGSLFKYRL